MTRAAFTMAEILLSLTIIGVVAAITLPSLTGNINERTWNTQRKALYARMSQAIALMPALNGYGTLIEGNESTSAVDTATETFVTDGLSKVMKINNICDAEHLEDCGLSKKITDVNGSTAYSTIPKTLAEFNSMFNGSATDINGTVYSWSQPDTKAAAFETQNGESILVYYYPNCLNSLGNNTTQRIQEFMCANMVYDLNGSKGPNTAGKDIGFISILYPSDPVVVAPVITPYQATQNNQTDAIGYCKKIDQETRLPNFEEVASLTYNKNLSGLNSINSYGLWTSSKIVENNTIKGRYVGILSGIIHTVSPNTSAHTKCIKR